MTNSEIDRSIIIKTINDSKENLKFLTQKLREGNLDLKREEYIKSQILFYRDRIEYYEKRFNSIEYGRI